jgi:membrane protease YdiL (CAAX protease family)
MVISFWSEFSIFLLAAFFGSIAILPYSLRLLKSSKSKKLKMPYGMLFLLSIIQNIVLFAVTIGIGLVATHQIGLNVQWVNTQNLLLPVLLGILGGGFLLIADMLFLPYFPEKLLNTALKTTLWENFTASFYGGINEELFTRLFGVSVIAWLLSKIWHTPVGLPTTSVYWTAIVFMAIIFALGHLPALKGIMDKITSVMFFRTILLNTPIGLLCGWLFWQYGIEAAILAHFAADIVYHIGGTLVLRSKFKRNS